MKLLIIFVLLGFHFTGFGQELKQLQFIDYSTVIRDIRSANPKGDLTFKWDYKSVLLLDTANIN